MTAPVVAAYGFRLPRLEARWLGVTGGMDWPEVACTIDRHPSAPDIAVDADRLELRVRADLAHNELVHPLLGRVGGFLAAARGHDAIHAGAVAGLDGAWVVVGPKCAGKSTLLAGLAAAGAPIITDDVLVFGGGVAMAGPRCIDLRPDMTSFGLGVDVRPGDPRNRVPLPPIAAEHQLAGLIHLEWSAEETTIEPLDPADAIKRLLTVRSEKGWPREPRALLDLGTLPTLCLKRPRSMEGLQASVAYVRRLLSDARIMPDGRPARIDPVAA